MMVLNVVNLASFYFSHYNITASSLIVKHGFILRTEIPFENIRHIKYSGKTLRSEKWTRQQLEIHYNLFDSVTTFVPQKEKKFISLLKENCPQMKVLNMPANKYYILALAVIQMEVIKINIKKAKILN